jgi:hypothetical protein
MRRSIDEQHPVRNPDAMKNERLQGVRSPFAQTPYVTVSQMGKSREFASRHGSSCRSPSQADLHSYRLTLPRRRWPCPQ